MATSSAKSSSVPVTAAIDRAEIDAGRRTLEIAQNGLAALAAGLGDEFVACIDLLADIPGRVVVTGMGKSGHVGCKIAATLASTGRPAHFVHAGEASHGDLGMIASGDAVLAISNSGETPELANVVAYTRRFGIPLVAITGKRASSLAQAADIVLLLPDVPEAGLLGLAPTTSTTMTIALGDAIAVALLERRGFSADAFAVFHPGGQLGRQLFKVADLMHGGADLPLVELHTPMSDVIMIMTSKTFGVAGVIDGDGKLTGIVTDGDLRRHISGDLFKLTAAQVMTRAPKTTTQHMLAAEALRRMNDWKITSVFVIDAGKPVGILRMHDVLRAGAV